MTRVTMIGLMAVMAAPALCSATVADTGANTATYTGVNNSNTHFWCGFQRNRSDWTGSNGVYTMTMIAEAIPETDVQQWYDPDASTRTLDGWRQKTLVICPIDTQSVTYIADLAVQITGHLNADNGLVSPLGNVSIYAWAKMIATGLGSKTVETKGDPYTIEEGIDGTVDVTIPIKVSLPINVSEDTADLNGNDSDSVSGTKPNATNAEHIRVRGRIVGRSKSGEGGVRQVEASAPSC